MASKATSELIRGSFRSNPFSPNKSFSSTTFSVSTRFLTRSQRSLIRSILSRIEEDQDLLVLIGVDGLGKSALLSHIVTELPDSAKAILLQCQTTNGPVNVPESILAALGVLTSKPERAELVGKLRKLGLQQRSGGGRMLLFLDDASNLAEASLKAFLELVTLVNAGGTLFQLVLAGEPALCSRVLSLREPPNSLSKAAVYEVLPFTADEIDEYIECRMRAAGEMEGATFSRAARAQIAKISRGLPALIDRLCEKALEQAWRKSKTLIDSDLIEDSSVENPVLENGAATQSARAPFVTLEDSNCALIPGVPDPTRFQALIAKHRKILAGAATVTLLFLIGATICAWNWRGFLSGAHDQNIMTAGERSSVQKAPAPQMRPRTDASEQSLATIATTDSSGVNAASESPRLQLTEQKPPAKQFNEIVNGEPARQSTQSIMSQRLLEDGARLLNTHNYDDAIKTYQTALISDPQNRDLIKAISQANKAKTAEKNSGNGSNHNARVVARDSQVSNTAYKGIFEPNKQRDDLQVQKALEIGRKFLALGDYDEAVTVLRSGLSIDPKNETLRAELARAHSAQSAEEEVLGSP